MSDPLPSILFVDDERNILKALRRLFVDEEWDLLFAESGAEALEILAETPVDIVVSDFRMPEMDGYALLKEVQARYPATIRLFLSGYAEKESLSRSLAEGCAHMVLAKPWDDNELRQVITKSLADGKILKAMPGDLQVLFNNIPSIPPMPEICRQVQACLSDRENVSFEDLGALLETDVGMSASLLRWANSPIFGHMGQVDTVQRAIVVLGLAVIEGLVLSNSLVTSFEPADESRFDLRAYQRHSVAVGILARLLAIRHQPEAEPELADRAFTAGLLHDMGKLVEARYFEAELAEAFSLAEQETSLLQEAEKTVLGFSHGDVGSFLVSWWNLPDFIVEAVRWHHTPGDFSELGVIPKAVHVANVLAQKMGVAGIGNSCPPEVDPDCWELFDITEAQIEAWRPLVAKGADVHP